MSGTSSRNKGQRGEREIIDLIYFCTGILMQRNLDQVRNGGHDLNGIVGLSIEVKRQERLQINTWWKQTLRQAKEINSIPILAYRQNNRPWKFIVSTQKLEFSKLDFVGWLDTYVNSNRIR